MQLEKEVSASPQLSNDTGPAPRKPWETPRFDRHDVRATTLAKGFNNAEDMTLSGPMS